ncbi:MAG: MarR family transcriptional regulator [Clostridiales bacterium]|nr:MarR family transcriptional regulator [Clostridiales bacterium]
MENIYPIGQLLNHISKDIHMYYRQHLKDYDMGWGQLKILFLLFNTEGKNQEELSSLLDIDKTTVTRTLKKMALSGLIRKEANPLDKRAQLIFLTEKAKGLHKYLNDMKFEVEKQLLTGFSKDEIDIIYSLLIRLKNNSESFTEEKTNE